MGAFTGIVMAENILKAILEEDRLRNADGKR